MEQITSFFKNLSTKSSTVAINISSRSVLEVIEFNKEGLITNYAAAPIQYNAFTKEIENINDFESAIKRTFQEMGISFSSKVYVSIPTFIIETETLPMVDDEDAIKTMLVSSAEKNYIFKKYDPAISYYKTPSEDNSNLNVVYTALRQDEFGKMTGVFEALGMKVVAIDSSYSSLINGVIATQKVNPNIINNNETWNIINITSNSFMIFAMKGKNLTGIYEEPLAVKSFTEEEIYQVISNSLELALEKYPSNQLVFVSQSDNVSAEYLSSIINTDVSKVFIQDNKERKQLVELDYNITQSNKTRISLEAVGIAHWAFNEDGFKFNFANTPVAAAAVAVNEIESILIGDFELTPQKLKRYSIIYALIVIIVLASAYFTGSYLKNGVEITQSELVKQEQDLDAKLNQKKEPEVKGITEAQFLQNSYKDNQNLKKSYASIAREIPDMLWIEEVQLANNSKVYLSGRSYRMDDILNYYDSLNKLGKFPNLKINVLKIGNHDLSTLIKSDMSQETTYEFVFGDSFFTDPNATPAPAENASTDDKKSGGAPLPPPPPGGNTSNSGSGDVVPPAPTAIPKEDN